MIGRWIFLLLVGSSVVVGSFKSYFLTQDSFDRDYWVFQNCFYTNGTCPNENITFWLYTRETASKPKQLNVEALQSADFTPKKPVAMLIHGYTGNRDASPNTQIRDPLLETEDIYVVSVDYSPLATEPCYPFAVENAKYISKCIAQFLDNLAISKIVSMDDIHVIGFSLGAQIAGIISNYVQPGKLKWITGLDPAKPIFNFFDNDGRLDRTDADFVDVIHTDVMERGMLVASGHVDFYPNGGIKQPGCDLQNETSVGQCNHDRAPEFYAESILKTTKGFWGYGCYSWFNFVLGFCRWTPSSEMNLMGYRVPKNKTGIYFMETSPDPPFALGPYPNEATNKLITLPNGQEVNEDILHYED